MPDREKVIKALERCSEGEDRDCDMCEYTGEFACQLELIRDALALLQEQDAEIAFLKAMQLQTIHNMSNEDIGNAVRNVLRL